MDQGLGEQLRSSLAAQLSSTYAARIRFLAQVESVTSLVESFIAEFRTLKIFSKSRKKSKKWSERA